MSGGAAARDENARTTPRPRQHGEVPGRQLHVQGLVVEEAVDVAVPAARRLRARLAGQPAGVGVVVLAELAVQELAHARRPLEGVGREDTHVHAQPKVEAPGAHPHDLVLPVERAPLDALVELLVEEGRRAEVGVAPLLPRHVRQAPLAVLEQRGVGVGEAPHLVGAEGVFDDADALGAERRLQPVDVARRQPRDGRLLLRRGLRRQSDTLGAGRRDDRRVVHLRRPARLARARLQKVAVPRRRIHVRLPDIARELPNRLGRWCFRAPHRSGQRFGVQVQVQGGTSTLVCYAGGVLGRFWRRWSRFTSKPRPMRSALMSSNCFDLLSRVAVPTNVVAPTQRRRSTR